MNLEAAISQKEFAELIGVSEATVSQWLTAGHLRRGASCGAWIRAYCERLREQAAGRDPTGELTSERARLAREQADRAAMDNAERRGTLVKAKDIEPAIGAAIVSFRESLLQLSRRVVSQLTGKSAEQMALILEDEHRKLLVQLANWRRADPRRQTDDESDEDIEADHELGDAGTPRAGD